MIDWADIDTGELRRLAAEELPRELEPIYLPDRAPLIVGPERLALIARDIAAVLRRQLPDVRTADLDAASRNLAAAYGELGLP